MISIIIDNCYLTENPLLHTRCSPSSGDLDLDRHVHDLARGQGGDSFLNPRPTEGCQTLTHFKQNKPDMESEAYHRWRALVRARNSDGGASADKDIRDHLSSTYHDPRRQETPGEQDFMIGS